MDIKQVQEFRLFDRRPQFMRIVRFHRIWWGAFQNCFRMEIKDQRGNLLNAKPCPEEYAAHYLERALKELPREDVEVVKFEPVDVSRPTTSVYF